MTVVAAVEPGVEEPQKHLGDRTLWRQARGVTIHKVRWAYDNAKRQSLGFHSTADSTKVTHHCLAQSHFAPAPTATKCSEERKQPLDQSTMVRIHIPVLTPLLVVLCSRFAPEYLAIFMRAGLCSLRSSRGA